MGSPCLFTRQRGVKIGYFYWLRVKNSNHLHTELSLGYLKDAKFYLESKASFIDISSIVSFKLFLIAWLREYRIQFRTVLRLAWSPRLGQNTPSWELFSKKNRVPLSNFFSSSNMFFIRLFLANTWKKIRGSPCSFKRKGEFISPSSLVKGNLLTFVRARARVRALMTRKSCALGMRNAILRNYLK